jgi:hypothetical protein
LAAPSAASIIYKGEWTIFPEDDSKSYPHHLGTLREYATSGIKHIMACIKDVETNTASLPDELKVIAEVLTKYATQVLIESHVESLKLISELGLQEITRARIPPISQTEPDHIEKAYKHWRVKEM